MLPASSAGASLETICCSGKFHGVIAPTTPIGSRTISELPTSSVQAKSSARPAMDSTTAAGNATWAVRDIPIGEPISAVIAWAISSVRAAQAGAEAAQHVRPVLRGGRRPGREGGSGGGDGAVDVGGGAGRGLGDDLAGGRVDDGKGVGGAGDGLATDPVAGDGVGGRCHGPTVAPLPNPNQVRFIQGSAIPGWGSAPQSARTIRPAVVPASCRAQASAMASNGTISWSTVSRPAAACPATTVSAAARCAVDSPLLV